MPTAAPASSASLSAPSTNGPDSTVVANDEDFDEALLSSILAIESEHAAQRAREISAACPSSSSTVTAPPRQQAPPTSAAAGSWSNPSNSTGGRGTAPPSLSVSAVETLPQTNQRHAQGQVFGVANQVSRKQESVAALETRLQQIRTNITTILTSGGNIPMDLVTEQNKINDEVNRLKNEIKQLEEQSNTAPAPVAASSTGGLLTTGAASWQPTPVQNNNSFTTSSSMEVTPSRLTEQPEPMMSEEELLIAAAAVTENFGRGGLKTSGVLNASSHLDAGCGGNSGTVAADQPNGPLDSPTVSDDDYFAQYGVDPFHARRVSREVFGHQHFRGKQAGIVAVRLSLVVDECAVVCIPMQTALTASPCVMHCGHCRQHSPVAMSLFSCLRAVESLSAISYHR